MQFSSRLLATGKEFVPITAKRCAQTCQRGQAWKIVTGFDVLNVAGAHADFFCQSFLSQIPTRPQCGDVLSESLSVRSGFGFARRHGRIFAESSPAKHEALPREPFSLSLAA